MVANTGPPTFWRSPVFREHFKPGARKSRGVVHLTRAFRANRESMFAWAAHSWGDEPTQREIALLSNEKALGALVVFYPSIYRRRIFAEFSSNLADLCKRSFIATDLEERLEDFESSHGCLPSFSRHGHEDDALHGWYLR